MNAPTMHRRRVGNWVLEWASIRPATVWAIPQHIKNIPCGSSGILYHDGTMGWDNPYRVPAYVRNVAPSFVARCQNGGQK
jgi:hypothetical protein